MDHRILVIEDDPTIREVLVEVLGEHGYEAAEAGPAGGRPELGEDLLRPLIGRAAGADVTAAGESGKPRRLSKTRHRWRVFTR